MKTNSDELTPQQIAAEEQLLADLHKTRLESDVREERKSRKRGWLWVGIVFLLPFVPDIVKIPMWPRPYVLQIWTLPSGFSPQVYRTPLETYMISKQECEEARAALGSKFRSECIGIGSTVRKRQWQCWSTRLAQKAEGADCAASSVTGQRFQPK